MALLARKAAFGSVRSAKVTPQVKPCGTGARGRVITRALDDNLFVNLLASGVCSSVVAAVTIATSEERDKEIERIQTLQGATPLLAAVGADAIAHSLPGLNLLLGLVTEPIGAASGVAYMMSILLSAQSIDPATLAPKGTVLNAEKAKDASAAVRVPFTQIIPTVVKVVDPSNEGYSGAAWKVVDGVPKLPINSVLIILGVGGLILELVSHAPLLSLFMPRVLQVAAWFAIVGAVLDKRE